jgi:hypothetical protein
MIAKGLVTAQGKTVSKSYFYHIIRNELYVGWINKFGERHKGNFTPIVSDALFSKVQSILSSKFKKPFVRITDNPDFPLRRFFKHSSGKVLTGCWSQGNKQKYPYYLIHGKGINLRKEELEKVFKNWLNQYKMNIEYFENLYRFTTEKIQGNSKNEREYLENKIIELKERQNIILNKNINGIISDDFCKEKFDEINIELFDIKRKLKELPENFILKTDILNIVREALLQPGELWEKANLEDKIKLQWFYFPEGIIIDNNGSRTTKICKLFKLSELKLPTQSYNVDYPNSKSNMNNWQILRIDDKSQEGESSFIHDSIQELNVLDKIINNKTLRDY